MLKSVMEFLDVIFPLNLGPLTYKVPLDLRDAVYPGAVVTAEIKNTPTKGIALGPPLSTPEEKIRRKIKEISEVAPGGRVLSPSMLKLIAWMAEYYLASEGTVLKGILPPEFWQLKSYEAPSHGAKQRRSAPPEGPEPSGHHSGAASAVKESLRKKYYKTFLLHASSTAHEISFLSDVIHGGTNVIVICPEHAELKHAEETLRPYAGDRMAVYHGNMTKKRRREALESIITGQADIVLGNRSAVFAPLKEVSLIAVLREESISYKEERGVKYNARDMAVMRGYLEGATVLLSSVFPSVESHYNASVGKYSLIESAPARRPKIRVLDVRKYKSQTAGSPAAGSPVAGSPVAWKLRQAAERAIKRGERAVFLINRKGFSMLRCRDCGHTSACGRCAIPLEFYRTAKTLRCRYCGGESRPPQVCPQCGGLMDPLGAGIERIEEELKSMDPLGVRDKAAMGVLEKSDTRIVIGTKAITRQPGLSGSFSLAGILNADAYLHVPDFRATERAFMDLVYAAERVKPDGEIIIQTRAPKAPLFKYLRTYDLKRFYIDELLERKAMGYPPFSKMALVTSDKEVAFKTKVEGVEVLGPVESITKRGKKQWKTLFKAPSAKQLQKALRGISVPKGIKLGIDIDPASV